MAITHITKPGETLWGLAEQYLGAGKRWTEITGYTGVPEELPIGQELTIPGVEVIEPIVVTDKEAQEKIGEFEEMERIRTEITEKQAEVKRLAGLKEIEEAKEVEEKRRAEEIPAEVLEEEEEEETPLMRMLREQKEQIEAFQEDYDKVRTQLEEAKIGLDDATSGIVDSIQKSYAIRIEEQQAINKRAAQRLRTLGYRTGGLRYAGAIFEGIMNAEERAALSRIHALEGERDQLIAETKMAIARENYEEAYEAIEKTEERRNKLTEEYKNLYWEALKENERKTEENEKGRRQQAVITAFDVGYTSLSAINNLLNFDEAGKFIDYISLEEIEETLGMFAPEEEELLSVSEAKSLGVPYGTTRQEAIAMGLVPGVVAEEEELLTVSEAEKLGLPYGTTRKEAVEKGIIPEKEPTAKETEQAYKAGLLADKTEGMSYEDARAIYSAYVSKDWIDWVYERKEIKTEKEKAQEALYKEMNEWLEKVKAEPDKYKIRAEGIYEVKKFWPDKKVYGF